jgi:hypothetical protein
MSLVAISGNASGTGTLTIAAPNTNSNFTLNLPAATGTVMVSGNMPAFSAYGSTAQTVSTATFTKIAYNTEEFDTNSNYDNTTNYRFTPTVAGYYQISANIFAPSSALGLLGISIYKNGARYRDGSFFPFSSTSPETCVSALVYCNGSTDYVEIYGYQTSGGNLSMGSNSNFNFFTGVLVRGA